MLSQAGSNKHHNFYYTSAVWPIHFDRSKTQKVEVRVSSWIRTHWVLTTSFNANRGLFISCTTTCSEQRQTRQAFAFLEKWRRTREIASTVWQGRKINRVAGIIFNWTIPKNTECYELAVVYLCVCICVCLVLEPTGFLFRVVPDRPFSRSRFDDGLQVSCRWPVRSWRSLSTTLLLSLDVSRIVHEEISIHMLYEDVRLVAKLFEQLSEIFINVRHMRKIFWETMYHDWYWLGFKQI